MARPAQVTKINKIVESLQYLIKIRDEVDFLCR